MPKSVIMSVFLCAGVLFMGSQSFRIQGKSAQAAKSAGIHDGPPSWWSNFRGVVQQFGLTWTAKCSVFDFVAFFSNGDEFERSRKGQPYLEGETQEHYKVFLHELAKEGLKIEKLKRLQAGCEDLPEDAEEELTRVFQRQTFEAVAKLAKEFPTPRDLFSLMPESAAKAKKQWVYRYSSPNMSDFQVSHRDFLAWTKEKGLDFKDVDRDSMLFDGYAMPEFQQLHPKPEDLTFPVDIMYIQETETFHPDMIDTVENDWASVPEQPVSRDAFVKHFLSKAKAHRLPPGGTELLKEALEGAFDVCTRLTMPTAMKLDEHAFRYSSALAYEMFLDNMPRDEC